MNREAMKSIAEKIESEFRVDPLGSLILTILLTSEYPLTRDELKVAVGNDKGFSIEMMSLMSFGYLKEVPTLFDKKSHYTVSAKINSTVVDVHLPEEKCTSRDQLLLLEY